MEIKISKNIQDYLIAVMGAVVAILTTYSNAPIAITVPVLAGDAVIILNALLDVARKKTA